jgi:hypothetical protein
VRHHAVAYVALFVALGGTSYAATQLPANSVGTRQVVDHSLLARDFKSGQLPRGARGQDGPAGPAGPQGATGAQGVAGPQGASGPQGPKGDTGPAGTPGGTLTTLPSGQSESAPWGVGDSSSGEFVPITFAPPLAAGLAAANLHFMGATTSAQCPGAGHAAAGQLCVYTAPGRNNLTFDFFDDPVTGFNDSNAASFGVNMYLFAGASSTNAAAGSWTVTAP